MRRSLLTLSALAMAGAAARAQEPVLLRISGTPGQANKYQMVNEMYVLGGQMAMMAPDTTVPFTRTTIYSTRTLLGSAGDTLTFQEVIDSAKMESPAMPQMGAMMGAQIQMMKGQTTTTKMSNRGRVYSSDVSGGMAAMGGPGGGPGMGGPGGRPGMGGPGRRPGGMGGGNRGGRSPLLLPEQPVRPGDTWSDSMNIDASGDQPAQSIRGTFKLERVDNRGGARVAVISWNGVMTTTTPMGQQVMNATSELDLDLTASRLASMTMTMRGSLQSPQGEMPVKMSTNMSPMP